MHELVQMVDTGTWDSGCTNQLRRKLRSEWQDRVRVWTLHIGAIIDSSTPLGP